jgi:hypothetical protein
MAGKIVARKNLFQPAGRTVAEVRGVPVGAYVIQIETETFFFSEMILSNDGSGNNPEINFQGSGEDTVIPVATLKSSNSTSQLAEMQYSAGDTLSLTAYLDDHHSEIKIVPVASDTAFFDFRQDMEDITATADITVEGGVLQVSDESGCCFTDTSG